jgi:SAM-dependent methyltransferase
MVYPAGSSSVRAIGDVRPALRYSIDRVAIGPQLAETVVVLDADEETLAFVAAEHARPAPRLRWLAHGFLRGVLTDYDVNGLLGTYRLFLLSSAQWATMLDGVGGGRLLDVGAGSGDVTARMAPSFTAVHAVETSRPMVRRLRRHGFVAHRVDISHTPAPGAPYDSVALLNVLDRSARPAALLAAAYDALADDGVLIVSMPLPMQPFYQRGARTLDPVEALPVVGTAWEGAARSLAEDVLAPNGFTVTRLTRAPYLSGGDRRAPFYELDAVVIVAALSDRGATRRSAPH